MKAFMRASKIAQSKDYWNNANGQPDKAAMKQEVEKQLKRRMKGY